MTTKTIKISTLNDLEKMSTLGFTIQDEIEEEIKKGEDVKGWSVFATNEGAKMRSLAQNALAATYYNSISGKFKYSIEESKIRCKIDFGLDALLIQCKDTNNKGELTQAALDAIKVMKSFRAMSFKSFTYESKMTVMALYPCTSLMTNKTFCSYLKEVEIHYAKHGLVLESINESKMLESY